MDTKSKNSRKFGILILILLLAASSAVMMLQYGTIRRQIESVQEEGSRSEAQRIWRIRWRKAIIFFIIGMYGTLIRRKYFLFTDSKGLIWQKNI